MIAVFLMINMSIENSLCMGKAICPIATIDH